MIKSVYVSNYIPECCAQCSFDRYHERFKYNYCMIDYNLKQIDNESVRPDWCRLKVLPDRLQRGEADGDHASYANGIADGWNMLLDYLEDNSNG